MDDHKRKLRTVGIRAVLCACLATAAALTGCSSSTGIAYNNFGKAMKVSNAHNMIIDEQKGNAPYETQLFGIRATANPSDAYLDTTPDGVSKIHFSDVLSRETVQEFDRLYDDAIKNPNNHSPTFAKWVAITEELKQQNNPGYSLCVIQLMINAVPYDYDKANLDAQRPDWVATTSETSKINKAICGENALAKLMFARKIVGDENVYLVAGLVFTKMQSPLGGHFQTVAGIPGQDGQSRYYVMDNYQLDPETARKDISRLENTAQTNDHIQEKLEKVSSLIRVETYYDKDGPKGTHLSMGQDIMTPTLAYNPSSNQFYAFDSYAVNTDIPFKEGGRYMRYVHHDLADLPAGELPAIHVDSLSPSIREKIFDLSPALQVLSGHLNSLKDYRAPTRQTVATSMQPVKLDKS